MLGKSFEIAIHCNNFWIFTNSIGILPNQGCDRHVEMLGQLSKQFD